MADVIQTVEQKIEAFLKDLEGKAETVLRQLYADALVAESDAKKEIVILRQRAANMATDAEKEIELAIVKAKEDWQTALAWLKALEIKLFGTDGVKDFNTGQTFKDSNE